MAAIQRDPTALLDMRMRALADRQNEIESKTSEPLTASYQRQFMTAGDTFKKFVGNVLVLFSQHPALEAVIKPKTPKEYADSLTQSIKDQDAFCPISLDVIDEVVITKCGHIFDLANLQTHLLSSEECPLCRTKIAAEDLTYSYARELLIIKVIQEKVEEIITMCRTHIHKDPSPQLSEVEADPLRIDSLSLRRTKWNTISWGDLEQKTRIDSLAFALASWGTAIETKSADPSYNIRFIEPTEDGPSELGHYEYSKTPFALAWFEQLTHDLNAYSNKVDLRYFLRAKSRGNHVEGHLVALALSTIQQMLDQENTSHKYRSTGVLRRKLLIAKFYPIAKVANLQLKLICRNRCYAENWKWFITHIPPDTLKSYLDKKLDADQPQLQEIFYKNLSDPDRKAILRQLYLNINIKALQALKLNAHQPELLNVEGNWLDQGMRPLCVYLCEALHSQPDLQEVRIRLGLGAMPAESKS